MTREIDHQASVRKPRHVVEPPRRVGNAVRLRREVEPNKLRETLHPPHRAPDGVGSYRGGGAVGRDGQLVRLVRTVRRVQLRVRFVQVGDLSPWQVAR